MRLANLLLHDLQGPLPADHRRDWVPGGYLGTAATIERMREFVTQYKRDFNIRALAAQIIKNCPAKDYYSYAKALYEFCRDRIKYAYDPHLVELVESPLRVVQIGIADCDSICTLLGSLNESIGLKTRFRTIKADAKRPDDFSHVYCMVRVPQSRFSASKTFGWIAEDATLPDKQFGWEPAGGFKRKDWAASKDKDSEDGDDPLLGAIEMSPMSETQAQLEIDQLCSSLNLKLIEAMRKGLEWSDPKKANILAVVVGRFSQLASRGIPTQVLPAARSGYAYWSPILDEASSAVPDFGLAPNLSGYSGLGAEMVPVFDGSGGHVNPSRIDTFINTVDWKYQNLKNSGAEAKFPSEMANIRSGLYAMQSLLAQVKAGKISAERAELSAQKLYKVTVQLETDLARKLTMVYPAGTFGSRSIPDVVDTPMRAMLTKPDVSTPIGRAIEQAKASTQAKTSTQADDFARKVVRRPDGGYDVVDGKGSPVYGVYVNQKTGEIEPPKAFPWLAVGLGLAGAAAAYFIVSRRGRQ